MADLKKSQSDEELKHRVIEQLDALDRQGKLKVLDFSRSLASGVRGRGGALLTFAGSFPEDDLYEIEKVIEEEFEKVDEEGW